MLFPWCLKVRWDDTILDSYEFCWMEADYHYGGKTVFEAGVLNSVD